MNVDRWPGPERGSRWMQEQGSDGEDQAGLSQGSADGFERIAIRCRRVWLVAGAGVPLRMDQTLGDSETTRITRNEAQCWRGRQWTGN